MAASTNCSCLRRRISLRMTRAIRGTRAMAIAIMALTMLGPVAAMMASARRMEGRAKSRSITRMIRVSSQPPTYPAIDPSASPASSERPVATSPTSSETRAPAMMRDSTSRPNSSAPSTNRVLKLPSTQRPRGGSYLSQMLWATGSMGAIQGAKRAVSTRATTMKLPTKTERLPRRRLRRRAFAPRSGARLAAIVAVSLMADPRVEQAVTEVDQHVGDHEDGTQHEYRPLNEGEVTLGYGLDYEAPHAGPGEHVLDDYRAAQQCAELHPDHGHDRQQRVPQCVPDHDHGGPHALGARGAHEVGAEHLQ